MRYKLYVFLVATLLFAGLSSIRASEQVDEVIRLHNGGVSREIMLAYVANADSAHELNADEIQQLEDAGVPSTVIIAMIDQGKSGHTAVAAQTPAEPESQPAAQGAAEVVYAPPAEGLNISFFYEALAPHGHWHKDRAYGWVWQPTVISVHTGWRPYLNDGHWVWSDSGWYWSSDYPWGWAAFHYGRWHQSSSLGWVWVPDTTWGPAWVHWRECETHFGWAPLPPRTTFEAGVGFSFNGKHVGFDFHFGLSESHYAFVPCDGFLRADLVAVSVPRARVTNVYRQTTIVKNTYVYNDNRIVNSGVSVNRVSARTHQKVETVQIADAKVEAGKPLAQTEVRSGKQITAYRPAIAAKTPEDPPAVMARRSAARSSTQTQTRVHVSESDDEARRRLGEEKARQQAKTGADRKTVNKETAERHKAAVEEEKAARQRLNKEKAQKKSEAAQKRSAEPDKRSATKRNEKAAESPNVETSAPRKAEQPQAATEKKSAEPKKQQKEKSQARSREESSEEDANAEAEKGAGKSNKKEKNKHKD